MVLHPFDVAADDYDASFTDHPPGRWFRDAVWHHAREAFHPGEHLLDLGCGTGEDAVWLARQGYRVTAVDVSAKMLERSRMKAEAAGMADRITFLRSDLSTWDGESTGPLETFDGVLSNFGPLNCLESLRPLAGRLSRCLKPGGAAMLVVMGPICPWEILWYLIRGQGRKAFRRFKSPVEAHVAGGETIRVWYPSARRLRRAFSPHFSPVFTLGLGTLVPPPYLDRLVARGEGFFRALASLEFRLGRYFPFTWLNDHYLIKLKKSPRLEG
jgi:SAM-dependent methyltransferase